MRSLTALARPLTRALGFRFGLMRTTIARRIAEDWHTIIQDARAVVCHHSSVVHLAAAPRTPSVSA